MIKKSPHVKTPDSPAAGTPQSIDSLAANVGTPAEAPSPKLGLEAADVGSPFKRHRASMPGLEANVFGAGDIPSAAPSASAMHSASEPIVPPSGALPATVQDTGVAEPLNLDAKLDEDEEL